MANKPIGYYRLLLEVAPEQMAGSPALTLDLGVNTVTGQSNGTAEISQALPPPYGSIIVPQVTGWVRETGFGNNHRLLAVKGQFVVSVPPPAIGSYLANFLTALVLDEDGNGRGMFSYGDNTVIDCTVTNLDRPGIETAEKPFMAADPVTA
jgi:uncharacterized protein DUF1842